MASISIVHVVALYLFRVVGLSSLFNPVLVVSSLCSGVCTSLVILRALGVVEAVVVVLEEFGFHGLPLGCVVCKR